MGWILVSLSVLSLTSCGSPTSPRDVELDEEFQLAPSQSAAVGDTGLTLAFERVESDSRCGVDVTCFWEGDAEVFVTASQPGRDTATLELHTTTSGGRQTEARYGDFVIALRGLSPQPRSTERIRPEDYRATLRVTTVKP